MEPRIEGAIIAGSTNRNPGQESTIARQEDTAKCLPRGEGPEGQSPRATWGGTEAFVDKGQSHGHRGQIVPRTGRLMRLQEEAAA